MTIKKIKTYIVENWPIYLLIVLGIVIPLRWFSDGRIIGGGDHFAYFNPTNIFSDYFYTWIERVNLGEPNMEVQLLFPFLSFFKLFKLIGLSNVNSEIMWAIYQFLFAGVFTYMLVYYLIERKDIWAKISALIAGVFYMFNTNTMLDPLPIGARPIYTALPLLMFLWIRGIREEKTSLKYSILFSLATLLIASSNGGPAFIAPIIIAISFYTIYFLFFNKTRRTAIIFVFKSVLLTLIFNLWWVVPSYFALTESGQATVDYIRASDYTRSTKTWEAFRLMGFWAFRIMSSFGMDHIPFARYYYQFPLALISFLFPVIALLGLVVGKIRKDLFIFPILLLLGVFLSKGANHPFGEIFNYTYRHISFLSIFRNPYSKFTLLTLFSLSVVLGLSWSSIINYFSKTTRLIFSFTLLAFTLLLAYPMITGSSFQDPTWHNTTLDSQHVEVPQYWFDVGQWFKRNDPEARVMQFPKFGYGSCYNWPMGSCSGEPAGRMFLPNQVIKYPGSGIYYHDFLLANVYDNISSGKIKDIASALGFLGIKYALQQNDYAWYYGSHLDATPEKMAALFVSQKNLDYSESIGELDIYSVSERYINPWIYAVDRLTYIDGDASQAGKLIDFNNITLLQTYLFNDNKKLNSYYPLDQSIPKLTFKKINPTKYEVIVDEATKPFYLVFLSSFSQYWKARIIPGTEGGINTFLNGNTISEDRHFIANGYANGWLIKPEDFNNGTSGKIYLAYYPQNYLYLAVLISSISIIVSVGLIIIRQKER